MAVIDTARILSDAMSDPEFSREMRFFDGKMKLVVAGDETVAEFADGALVGISDEGDDGDCEIVVRGTREHWEEMLEPYPRPFYQCLQTTAVKHGLEMSTSNATYAYLPALNRLLVLMRTAYNGA